jgi:hypothetical protein
MLSELDDISLEERASFMSGFSSGLQQVLDDGHCAFLWVPSGIQKNLSMSQYSNSELLDVLSCKGLWQKRLALVLYTLDVLESVLLSNFSQVEPVDRKHLVLLCCRSQAVDGPSKLGFE